MGIKDLPNRGKCDSMKESILGKCYPIPTPTLPLKGREK